MFSELYSFDELCGSGAVDIADLIYYYRQIWFRIGQGSNIVAFDDSLSVFISPLLESDSVDNGGYLQFLNLL